MTPEILFYLTQSIKNRIIFLRQFKCPKSPNRCPNRCPNRRSN